MSLDIVMVKPHQHLLYPCDTERKEALLAHLIERHAHKKILVVSRTTAQTVAVPDTHITLTNDASISTLEPYGYDVVISYDLPATAAEYIARLEYAKAWALLLVDDAEQKNLHAIEMLLGRTIKKEIVAGFETRASIEAAHKAQALEAKRARKKEQQRILDEAERAAKRKPRPKTGDRNHKFDGTPNVATTPPKTPARSVTIRAKKEPKA